MENIEEKIKMMDKLLTSLHRRKLRRYYSVNDLRNKVYGLRIWSVEQLRDDLEIICCSIIDKKNDENYSDETILRKNKNGEILYKYNPINYKRIKLYKKISYSLKSEDELNEIRIKKIEDYKIRNWFWIKFGGITVSYFLGIASTVAGSVLLEIIKEKQVRLQNPIMQISKIQDLKLQQKKDTISNDGIKQ